MWKNGEYTQAADIIRKENWPLHKVAEFCAYMAKYLGMDELNIFHKFL